MMMSDPHQIESKHLENINQKMRKDDREQMTNMIDMERQNQLGTELACGRYMYSSPKIFQDKEKIGKFLKKCNQLFEDPYMPDDYPTHHEAIVARRSITNLDEYFRQLGYLDVRSRYIREVVDHSEGEDWSRVRRFIQDANIEFKALNTAYEQLIRIERDSLSQSTSDHDDYERQYYANTRLSKIDEAPSRLTDETKIVSPEMFQYMPPLHSHRSGYASSRLKNSLHSSHTDQPQRSERYAGHSDRYGHYIVHSHRNEHVSGHSQRSENHSGHSRRDEHYSVHSQRNDHHSEHSHRSEHQSGRHSNRSEHHSRHSHRSDHQSNQQVMDEELRLQLHLNLENMDQSDVTETNMPDPEATVPERFEQIEDNKRRGELASNAMKQNPDIADLSDMNRPGKVAERFRSLYDDLWTDACEQLTSHYQHDGNGERQAILDLAAILRATSDFTSKYVETQKERIAHQTMEIMLDPCSDRKQEGDSNPFRHEQVLARHAGSCIKDSADLSIPALQKIKKEIRYIKETNSRLTFDVFERDETNPVEFRKKYTLFKMRTPENQLQYKYHKHNFCHKNRELYHVLWNARLHLFPRNLTRVSDLPAVKTYTDKCVELTWFMYVQDPPMVLVWPDMLSSETDNITDYFRYCTATGTILDHEVWPAVFLYKNGPLVTKGVAQFKDSAI